MEDIAIGTSGLHASRIGLGTWAIGGWMWGGTDETESIATIRSAVDRGVTLIDTAPVYGFGRSEEIVGKALAEGGLRDKVRIASKVGLAWKDGAVFRDSRPARIRKELEDSEHDEPALPHERFDRPPEWFPVDLVPVAEQKQRRGFLREGLDPLAGGPLRRRVRRHVEVHHPSAVVRQIHKPEQDPEVAVGTTKKSSATRSFRWFSRNARHVGEGGLRRRGMYFATVETATSIPTFASSFRMRGAPQITFVCAILQIRLTTSRSSPGRPRRPGRLFRLQNLLNPSRCHRITVAGSTIARASLQPFHPCESITQKARSHTPSRRCRPPRVRISAATCCRSARFSSASSAASGTATASSRGGSR